MSSLIRRLKASLAFKFMSSVVAVGLLAVAAAGALFYVAATAQGANESRAEYSEATEKFQVIQRQFDLQRAFQAEYAYSGDETLLEDFEASAVIAFATVDELAADYARIAGVSEAADRIRALDEVHDEAFFAELPPAVEAGDAAAVADALQHSIDNLANLQQAVADFQAILSADAVTVDESLAEHLNGARLVAVTTAIVALLALVVVTFVVRRAVAPIQSTAEVAGRLGSGEVNVEIDVDRTDEIGAMVSAFRRTIDYRKEMAATARAVADGDLTVRFDVRSENDELGLSLNEMIDSLRQVVGDALAVATTVTQSAEQVAQGASASSMAAEEVARSISTVASAATEQAQISENLGEAVTEIETEASQAVEASSQVVDASGYARSTTDEGLEHITGAAQAMDAVTEAFTRVAGSVSQLEDQFIQVEEIVDLIRSIAEQTNLLALNAAIEAARAGESGRGFAVVAGEVKSLAEESAVSTEKIASIVSQMKTGVGEAARLATDGRADVERSSDVVSSAGEAFRSISDAITGIDSQAQGTAVANRRILEVVERIAGGARQLAGLTESNSAVAEEVAASSEESSATATELGNRAEHLAGGATDLNQALSRFRI